MVQYRLCDNCQHTFLLPESTENMYKTVWEKEKKEIKIYCPFCDTDISHIITLSQYIGEIKHKNRSNNKKELINFNTLCGDKNVQ